MITYSTDAHGNNLRREPTMTRPQLEAIGRRVFQHADIAAVEGATTSVNKLHYGTCHTKEADHDH